MASVVETAPPVSPPQMDRDSPGFVPRAFPQLDAGVEDQSTPPSADSGSAATPEDVKTGTEVEGAGDGASGGENATKDTSNEGEGAATSSKQDETVSGEPAAVELDANNGGATAESQPQPANDSSTAPAEASSTNAAPIPSTEDLEKLGGTTVYSWMKDLSERVIKIEGSLKTDEAKDGDGNANTDTAAEKTDGRPEEDTILINTVPEVRNCTFRQFKNRYSDETEFAVETLRVSDKLSADIEDEQRARLNEEGRKRFPHTPVTGKTPRVAARTTMGLPDLQRVRINSSIVLGYLAKTSGQSVWSLRPHTFLKPFLTLVNFHDKMEAELRELEKKYAPKVEQSSEESKESKDETESQQQEKQDETVAQKPAEIDTKAGETKGPRSKRKAGEESPQTPIVKETDTTEKAEGTESHPASNDVVREAASCPLLDNKEVKEAMDSEKAYRDMKCYVEFARENLKPWDRQFDKADAEHPVKIHYEDLWSLFRPGMLVYERNDSDPRGAQESKVAAGGRSAVTADSHRIWRVDSVGTSPRPKWQVENLDDNFYGRLKRQADAEAEEASPTKDHSIEISAYYLDFDGTTYSGVSRYFTISWWPGEREIHKLLIFPLRFLRDREGVITKLRQRGQRFRNLITGSMKLGEGEVQAVAHDGWTRIHDPAGDAIKDEKGVEARHPQYIDSDVVIDFNEAYRTHPWWKPEFPKYVKHLVSAVEPVLEEDPFDIMYWDAADKGKEPHGQATKRVRELVITEDNVHRLQWNQFIEKDKFIASKDDNDVDEDRSRLNMELKDDDLLLLPSRIFAYALRHRRFINADLQYLKDIVPPDAEDDPFDNLQIEDDHKVMILSIVNEHFDKKKVRQLAAEAADATGEEAMNQDFIRNKGTGLVILLHGPPGVGKTATAEAVSASRGKPLFPITCGELGVSPEEVEQRLNEIFRLANLWDCILLLDEAEIFISQREKRDTNIQRNAMVSIFLRTLEYYPGILFLTTNRPGAMDEAVTSRVHVALEYPDLSRGATVELFRQNLRRLKKIEKERAARTGLVRMEIRKDEILEFAKDHWDDEKSGRWNGRQIRNAFQIASSLAHFEHGGRGTEKEAAARREQARLKGKPTKPPKQKRPCIGREHFQKVAKATTQFHQFRENVFGKTDADLAEDREERLATYNYPPPRPSSVAGRSGRGDRAVARDRYSQAGGSSYRGAGGSSRSTAAAAAALPAEPEIKAPKRTRTFRERSRDDRGRGNAARSPSPPAPSRRDKKKKQPTPAPPVEVSRAKDSDTESSDGEQAHEDEEDEEEYEGIKDYSSDEGSSSD